VVRIDLCGSNYDTGLYVYDADHSVVECNIDYYFGPPCGVYVSCIESAELSAGEFYYIVVTGMSGDSGDYVFSVTENIPCDIIPPGEAVYEGEPPLEDGYVDYYNGGCNSPEFDNPFQELVGNAQGTLVFAGRAGWYRPDMMDFQRDTDWFTAVLGASGTLEIMLAAEQRSYLFELGPQDCESVDVLQLVESASCLDASLIVTGEPGSTVWLWVGSTYFSPPGYPPGNEYDYLLTLVGLEPGVVTTERATWSAVKMLYR
jgi:hypothetical protein